MTDTRTDPRDRQATPVQQPRPVQRDPSPGPPQSSSPVQPEEQTRPQRIAGVAAALALVALAVWMLGTFLAALAWAVVLAIATWPLFVVARRHAGPTLAAAALTLLIAVAVLAPLAIAGFESAREFSAIAQWVIESRRTGLEAPQWISELPLVGPAISEWLSSYLQADHNPFQGADVRALSEWGQIIGRQAVRRTTTLLFALLIVFFVFRHSDLLIKQMVAVGNRLLGPQAQRLGSVAAQAVRGTVDGLLLVGLAEAVLIGIAYEVTGVPHPTLFGVLTGLFSAIPFAAPVVFIGAGVWLLAQSATAAAIGLVVFGGLVVFVADHFVRPAVIGGSTRLPFIWVLLGILGGIETFGLLGLFLGPVLLAVLITLWRELALSRH
jgi:predicted PurR-regulated permease PerM